MRERPDGEQTVLTMSREKFRALLAQMEGFRLYTNANDVGFPDLDSKYQTVELPAYNLVVKEL
jgi:hypothetical protein